MFEIIIPKFMFEIINYYIIQVQPTNSTADLHYENPQPIKYSYKGFCLWIHVQVNQPPNSLP